MKAMADDALAPLVVPHLAKLGVVADGRLIELCGLLKDRCDTLVALAQWVALFYGDVHPIAEDITKHVTEDVKPAMQALSAGLASCEWSVTAIASTIKDVLTNTGLKMPALAMPVRVLVMGTPQTPSLDKVLYLCGREKVLSRLAAL
jgi:glutamyl-tRNA synthetase